ncbi:MAG: CvpA family protein [Rufibacter sp.]
MSTFDYFLLLPVAYGAFKGFFRGVVLELASLVTLIVITVFGVKLVSLATPYVQEWLGMGASFAAYLLVFVGIGFAVRAMGVLVKKAVHLTPFGMMDNLLGAAVGGGKWAFAICLLVYFAHSTGVDTYFQTTRESSVYPFFVDAAPNAWAFVQWVIPFGREALENFA